jgi:SAM-dependent methyltransferase
MPEPGKHDSASATRERFDTYDSSVKYAGALDATATHRREINCIRQCLAGIPPGALVLDLPCGAGRLLPFLCASGYRVFAADSSRHMVARARELAAREGLAGIEFGVEDVLATSFARGTFDAVICNRLFHHFFESQVRIAALGELRRISRGGVIISFFCSRSLSSAGFLLKNRLSKQPATDRVPIPLSAITAEAAAAGLKVRKHMATKPFLGKQHYLELVAA